MDAYKKSMNSRKLLKAKVDSELKNFEDAIAASNLTEAEYYSDVICSLIFDIENLSDKIYDLIDEESALKSEMDFKTEIRKIKCKVFSQVNKIKKEELESLSTSADNSKFKSVKLPTLQIPVFSEGYEEWPGWFEQFEVAVHLNEQIKVIDKFNYLKTFTSGRAKAAIDGLKMTSGNYGIAIDLLKKQFCRPRLLIKSLLSKIIPKVEAAEEFSDLKDLYEKFMITSRSLKNLDVSYESVGLVFGIILEWMLPNNLTLEFQRKFKDVEMPQFEEILKFLEEEVNHLESIQMQQGFQESGDDRNSGNFKVLKNSKTKSSVSSLASFSNTKKKMKRCIFCSDTPNHSSYECKRAEKMSLEDRRRKIRDSKACFRCLQASNHMAFKCKFRPKCAYCKNPHQTLLCEKRFTEKSGAHTESADATRESDNASTMCAQAGVNNFGLHQTLRAKCLGEHKEIQINVLYDNGSAISFIKNSVAKFLGLPIVEKCSLEILGIGEVKHKKNQYNKYEFQVQKLAENSLSFKMSAIGIDNICSIQNQSLNEICVQTLKVKGIALNTLNGVDNSVDLLIGSDYFWEFMSGKFIKTDLGVIGIETKLGWTIQNYSLKNENSEVILNAMCAEISPLEKLDSEIRKFWELENIPEFKTMSRQNEQILANFKKDSTYKGKQYQVNLVWKEGSNLTSSNFNVSYKRLISTVNRLKKDDQLFKQYNEAITDYLRSGFAEIVPDAEISKENICYLPNQAVIRADKETSKLRVVFDGSASEKGHLSLNDCLEVGPNLNEDIFPLIARFRKGFVAVTADIRQAFLMIALRPDQHDFVRYLWIHPEDLDKEKPRVQHLRMKVVLFGLKCSMFLLSATIQHHLAKYEKTCPEVVSVLRKSFYVDDCCTSTDEENFALKFVEKSTEIMNEAGMELRKWKSNSKLIREKLERKCEETLDKTWTSQGKVLGISWSQDEDYFTVNVNALLMSEVRNTKRSILSLVSRIYDPMGWLSAFVIRSKIGIQGLWQSGVSWDEPLAGAEILKWKKFWKEINFLGALKIPRCYKYGLIGELKFQELHVFCDASEEAYAATAYIRSVADNVKCRLVACKSRVAPLSRISLPRLELMGSVIAARLAKSLSSILEIDNLKIFYWTDSMIVYHWIRGSHKAWKPFVANRIQEIQSMSNPSSWNHCPGKENPADVASRGIKAKDLVESSIWWNGPKWLNELDKTLFPKTPNFEVLDDVVKAEKRKIVAIHTAKEFKTIIEIERFSRLNRLIRVVAWVYRFIAKCRREQQKSDFNTLNSSELTKAELFLISQVQKEKFGEEIQEIKKNSVIKSSKLKNIVIFSDENILRIKGRLEYSDLENKHQILLPADHKFTDLVIWEAHLELWHAGVRDLVVHIRENFWIPRIRQRIKNVISKCIFCKRWTAKHYNEEVAPLPKERVSYSPPFSVVGIDFAGPVYLYENNSIQKGWICIFSCAKIRALHLELVSSMNVTTFLMAFKRFISRRGVPSVIISDNAKTFKKAAKDLMPAWNYLDSDEVRDFIAEKKIKWEFIVEKAPFWGGFYERMVKSIKIPLRKLLYNAKLGSEEFTTVLCQIEAIINSRPLTFVYSSANEVKPLTPGHFLCGSRIISQNIYDELSENDNLRDNFVHLESLKDRFWKQWADEYLPELNYYAQSRETKVPKIKVGDVVLLEAEKNRGTWKTGIVKNLLIGKDNKVRAAEVKTSTNVFKRPIQKLYPLELHSSEFDGRDFSMTKDVSSSQSETHDMNNSEVSSSGGSVKYTTKYGRQTRKPARYL